MKVKDWDVNKSLETKYKSSLDKLFADIIKQSAYITTGAEYEKLLQNLWESSAFKEMARDIARKFVINSDIVESKNWREVARSSNKGRKIYAMLKQSLQGNVGRTMVERIEENAGYITKMPLDISEAITKFVATETMKGRRADEISKELSAKFSQYTKARIDLIARTESSKATTALTEARSKDVGVEWYQWRTANDGKRVRPSHRNMQGVLVRWSDPPDPEVLIGEESDGKYHAGNIWNCRCYPAPIITLEQVSWPCRVYYNGTITRMTKAQFEKIQ